MVSLKPFSDSYFFPLSLLNKSASGFNRETAVENSWVGKQNIPIKCSQRKDKRDCFKIKGHLKLRRQYHETDDPNRTLSSNF